MSTDRLLHSERLSKLGWLEHGFSVGAADVRDLVDASHASFNTKQVHGDSVHVLDEEGAEAVLNGDAFIASKPGLVCSVRTADCVPILIADAKLRIVGAVHAGWKGTALNVVGASVARMRDAFGTDPADCVAAIGPRICGECYEVGEEVVREIARLDLSGGWRIDDSHVDLGAANAELLEKAGVSREQIEILPECTSCDASFASWRRDRSEGRQISYILVVR